MKFYFIAGENSGDFIGAKIIKSINNNNSQFYCVGGPQMESAGVVSLFDFQKINLMGFFEILPHIYHIKKLINLTVQDIINKNPDILITIDSPGFTLRVASKIRKLAPEIKLIHIVAPSVWAYKPNRALKYAKIYDKLLTLFPFEPDYFIPHGLTAECIGHPVLEQEFYPKLSMDEDRKIIAITPGSRKAEIERHMPVIRSALDILCNTHKIEAIFVQPNDIYIKTIAKYLNDAKFDYKFSTDRLKSFANADVAFAKSGTNTIEIAATGTPMIVGYRLNIMTYILVKMFVKIKYASIMNIIPNKEIIPEFIQNNFTDINIAKALDDLLSDKNKATAQVKATSAILQTIGFEGKKAPSQKAAEIIMKMVHSF